MQEEAESAASLIRGKTPLTLAITLPIVAAVVIIIIICCYCRCKKDPDHDDHEMRRTSREEEDEDEELPAHSSLFNINSDGRPSKTKADLIHDIRKVKEPSI